jgi:flagellar basal body-associated protein FliL
MPDRSPKPLPWRRRALLGALAALAALPAAAAEPEGGGEGGQGGHDQSEKPLLPGVPDFYNIAPIELPVLEGNNVTRQVGVLLTLELAEGHRQSEVKKKAREITDAFITELYRIYGWRSGDARIVNEALIKRRLQAAADRVLGAGVVHAILIRQLVEQER